MDLYDLVKSIGNGSFGQVYLAVHKREEKMYVIKRIKIRDMSQKDKENTENEVRLLQKLRHPNIVAYKDSYLDRDAHLNIVMIHCEGGDIYQKIRQANNKNYPENQILDWFGQMTLAMYYLHEQKILHRDLKTQNIFLKNGRIRLGDFGIAKVLDSTRDLANTCIGTPYYMSPELFKYKPYSYKSDIWAMGCCLYEMCNLRHAFDAQSINGLAIKILKGSYAPITQTYSKQFRDLINRMLDINPKMRPSIQEIIHKPMIKMRIILFMLELFNEQNTQSDIDDLYLDTLWEQADKIQVTPIINYYQRQLDQGTSLQEIRGELEKGGRGEQRMLLQIQEQEVLKKKMLRKEQFQKQKLEDEIKRLETRKNNPLPQKKSAQQMVIDRKTTNTTNTSITTNATKPQQHKDRSYSLEKDTPNRKNTKTNNTNNTKPQKRNQRNSSIETVTHSIERIPVTNNNNNNNNNKRDEMLNARDKVLQQKQKLVEEKNQKWVREFNQIQQQNQESRKKAQEKKYSQYRPSQGMSHLFGGEEENGQKRSMELDESNDGRKMSVRYNNNIQEEYGMDEEQSSGQEEEQDVQPIPEVENEDDYEEGLETPENVDIKLEIIKTKWKEKTYKINELQQSLLQSQRFKEQQIKALETGVMINVDQPLVEDISYEDDLNEDDDDEIEEINTNSDLQIKQPQGHLQIKLTDRIKLLKHRCEAGLGSNLSEKGFELVRERSHLLKQDEMRKVLIDLIGEENIAYWHLFDQIIYLEQLYTKYSQ